LWEETFKSVIVEDGVASRTMAAYIDLNPVRAGMVGDPADYRWSSYGEAMGASGTSGSKAKAGLVRAILADQGVPSPADARRWPGKVSKHYRMLLLEEGEEQLDAIINARGEHETRLVKKGMKRANVALELAQLEARQDVALRQILRWRIRYFSDGVAIGSRAFVERLFNESRDRFGAKRKNGSRKLRGAASQAAGILYAARDLKKDIE
jgi:hypothetical protein